MSTIEPDGAQDYMKPFRNLRGYYQNLWVLSNFRLLWRAVRGFGRALLLRKNTLKTIEIFPSMDCNMNCEMCSVEKFKRNESPHPPLGLADWERIAAESARMGAIALTILGGEPLMVKDLESIIKLFKKHHFFIYIVSNGSLITRERLIELKDQGMDGICFSLDSMDEDESDKIRGAQGYKEKVLQATRWAMEEGIFVRLAPVFFPGAIDKGLEVVKYCQKEGITASGTQVAPVGAWEGGEILSPSEHDRIRAMVKEYPRLTFDWALSYYLKMGCPAGKEKIAIHANGDVVGCSINPISFGNVNYESLSDIWMRMGRFTQFKKNASVCLASEDQGYIQQYIRPLRHYLRYPVEYRNHPAMQPEQEPGLYEGKNSDRRKSKNRTCRERVQTENVKCEVCGSKAYQKEAKGRDYVYSCCEQEFHVARCSGCGHLYLQPRPKENMAGTIYPENYASFQQRHSRGRWGISQLKSRIMTNRLKPLAEALQPGSRILDIGCGDGQLLIDLRQQFKDLELVGLDWKFSEEVRKELEKNDIRMITARIEDVDLQKDHFDAVLMNQLIEHLWEPRPVMAKIKDALRPGGYVSIETVNTAGYDRRFFGSGMWGGYYFPRHLNMFSDKSLKEFLEEIRFEVKKHINLVAPVIWTYSFRAVCRTRWPKNRVLYDFFSDLNPIPLSLFTALDFAAITMGFTTSNQKIIARRLLS